MTIETKFNIGDEVWVMTLGKTYCTTVISIHIDKKGLQYNLKYLLAKEEHELFTSKQELLDSL